FGRAESLLPTIVCTIHDASDRWQQRKCNRSLANTKMPTIAGISRPPLLTDATDALDPTTAQRDPSTTPRANAVQLHVPPVDAEAVQGGPLSVHRHGHLIEVNVPHLAALSAQEVVVVIGVDLELDRRSATLQRADQTGTHELLHVAVDGR